MDYLRIAVPCKRLLNAVTHHFSLRKMRIMLYYNVFSTVPSNSFQRQFSTRKKEKPPWNVLFFGTDEFSLQSLIALLKGKERGLIGKLDVVTKKYSTVDKFCRRESIDFVHWPIQVTEGIYDVGTVVSFGHLLPFSVISAFPFGILNIHGSLLPRWRGAAPVIHALLNNDQVTGVTVMEIQPYRFDVGRMISTAEVEIQWDTKSGTLTKQLANMGAQELISTLEDLPQKLQKAQVQPKEGITKAPKISEASSRIDWNIHTCRDIQARFRAFDDYYPLWTTWKGTPVKLKEMTMQREWSFSVVTESNDENSSILVKRQLNPKTKSSGDCESYHKTAYYHTVCSHEKNFENSTDLAASNININQRNLLMEKNNVDIVKPGTVIFNKKSKTISVKCVDNWVCFSKVAIKGRKLLTAHEFYNGFIGKVPHELRKFS